MGDFCVYPVRCTYYLIGSVIQKIIKHILHVLTSFKYLFDFIEILTLNRLIMLDFTSSLIKYMYIYVPKLLSVLTDFSYEIVNFINKGHVRELFVNTTMSWQC